MYTFIVQMFAITNGIGLAMAMDLRKNVTFFATSTFLYNHFF